MLTQIKDYLVQIQMKTLYKICLASALIMILFFWNYDISKADPIKLTLITTPFIWTSTIFPMLVLVLKSISVGLPTETWKRIVIYCGVSFIALVAFMPFAFLMLIKPL
jgi:hypothetical protein